VADDCVWIRTVPDLDGTYRCVVEIDSDTSHPITRDTASVYAGAVLQAAARAEQDAAVIRQITKVTASPERAVEVVRLLRGDRPPIDWPSPLRLEPGVSSRTGEGFLLVRIGDGDPVGQWTPAAAREHATGVMESVEVADLDGAYLRALRTIGIDETRARNVVDDLAGHRSEGEDGRG